MSHNKRRKSSILYEILVRQLSKAILEKNNELKESISILIKDYFGKNKLLREEKNESSSNNSADGRPLLTPCNYFG